MTTQTEALTLALDALRMPCNYWNKTQFIKVKEAIAAAEEALAQPEQDADRFCDANCTWSDHHPDCKYGEPEQEPVAVVTGVYGGRFTYAPFKSTVVLPVGMALYLQPPQRTWVELPVVTLPLEIK